MLNEYQNIQKLKSEYETRMVELLTIKKTEVESKIAELKSAIAEIASYDSTYNPLNNLTLSTTKKSSGRVPHGHLENIIMGLLSTSAHERKFRSDFVKLAEEHKKENVKINSIEQCVERLIVAGKIKELKEDRDNGRRSFVKIK